MYEMATGTLPFRGESSGVVFKAILDGTPTSAVRLNPDLPAELERIINKCLEKDRNLRYQHASEIRADLQRLKRDTDSRKLSAVSESAPVARNRRLRWMAAAAGATFAALVLVLIFWQAKRPSVHPVASASPTAIAVLPLQNAGSDKDIDFLRLALADEIATALSHVQSFSIRPSATTSKYKDLNADVQQAGRDMGVTSIVTGHFLKEGEQLEITLEAVDIATNRSVWRDTINAAASDRIAMREQITSRVRQGLVPALGAASAVTETGTRPKSEEAYDLFLRSIAVPHDVALNKDAISMLERAVGIDPSYAPAWEALGLRYYYDGTYGDGGEQMLKRSDSALERAVALDPNLILAAAQLITNRAERGEIGNAYAEASALVKNRPESAQAHFALGYVLRHVGLLDQSAHECETALASDRLSTSMQVRNGPLDHPLIFSCAKASWPRHAKAFKKRQLILLWLVTCLKAVLTTHRLRYWTESRRRLKPLRWRNLMGSLGITSEVCWRTVVGMMLPLSSKTRASVQAIVNEARLGLQKLADNSATSSALDEHRMLTVIKSRAENWHTTENNFGLSVVALLQKFGFCDADVIDKYLAANPRPDKIPDWASVLAAYRNATIHEGYLDFKKKHDANDVVRVCLQLKDALTRVILRECGYTGTYTPVLRRSYGPQPLDWIQPTTPASHLGF